MFNGSLVSLKNVVWFWFRSEKTENAAKDTTIKPAKLSRGRAPKPLLPLGRKLGKKSPAPSTKAKDSAADKGEENVSDKEQVSISVLEHHRIFLPTDILLY